jgi:hypothetical protein
MTTPPRIPATGTPHSDACRGAVIVTYVNGRVISVRTDWAAAQRMVPADIGDNGTTDYWLDADSDDHYEIAVLDTNGFHETFFVEGTTIQWLFDDRNENCYIEPATFDSDKDGNANWMVVDTDEDGVADHLMVDQIVADGIADTWVRAGVPASDTPPGASAQRDARPAT